MSHINRERSREQSVKKAEDKPNRTPGIKQTKIKPKKKTENFIQIDVDIKEDKNMIEKKDKITIPMIDDSNLLKPLSIVDFLNELNQKLANGDITLEEYVEINDLDDQKILLYLRQLIDCKDYNKFYSKYEKFQFLIKLADRIELQKLFQNEENLPNALKLNLINNDSIKLLS